MSTSEIVHRGLRYELMPVSMLISAAVSFCLLLKKAELLILRPTRHTGELLFQRVISVRDGKPRSVSTILVFFSLTLPLLPSDTPVCLVGRKISNSTFSAVDRTKPRHKSICLPGNPSSILGLDTMLRTTSEARVNRRLRRYYLIVLLLPDTFTLACLLLSSI